ncbi:MAG: hypothetical protein WBE59_11585 [Candidatus Cybelea sp.]
MNTSRSGFACCAIATLLSGCGPTRMDAISPTMQALTPGSQHAAVQRQPKTRHAIVYISSKIKASVYLVSYPSGKNIFTIIGFYAPAGLCSDGKGNVWVTDTDPYTGDGFLDEYAPGGKHAIATLEDPNNSPRACAVDPTTGNLAVANSQDNIAIYPDAEGTPTYYSTAGLVEKPSSIAYDAAGNAYLSGSSRKPGWLPAGAPAILSFKLKPNPSKHGPIRWDGRYLAVLVPGGSHDEVWRYELLGASAKRVGIVELDCCMGDYAIDGSILAATLPALDSASVSRYPAGGGAFLGLAAADPTGIAISASRAKK